MYVTLLYLLNNETEMAFSKQTAFSKTNNF